MAMKRLHTNQLTLALALTAAAVLAATVLLWGTEYKCSLYHRHPEKHTPVAMAKLLSERERPQATNQATLVSAPLSQTVFFALGLLLCEFFRKQRSAERWIAAPLRCWADSPRLRCCVNHFFFRPPPSLA